MGVPGGGSPFCLWWRSTQWKVGTSLDDWRLFLSKLLNSACFHGPVTRCEWIKNSEHRAQIGKQATLVIRNYTECVQMRRSTLNPCRLFLIYLRRLIIKKKKKRLWNCSGPYWDPCPNLHVRLVELEMRYYGGPYLFVECGTLVGNNPNVGLSLIRICVVWRFETHFRLVCTRCHSDVEGKARYSLQ